MHTSSKSRERHLDIFTSQKTQGGCFRFYPQNEVTRGMTVLVLLQERKRHHGTLGKAYSSPSTSIFFYYSAGGPRLLRQGAHVTSSSNSALGVCNCTSS